MNIENFINDYRTFSNKPFYAYEQERILRQNIQRNDTVEEIVIIMEELAELSQQVSKKIRGKEDKMHLLEEIADVYICLEELKMLNGFTEKEIEIAKTVKLNRIKNKLNNTFVFVFLNIFFPPCKKLYKKYI